MLLFVLLFVQVFSAILNNYRFGLSFGQVIPDYTSNNRDCINGDSYLTSTNDAKQTDRGIYFSGSTEQVTLPPNDKQTSGFNLPSTYSIGIWFNPDCDNCLLFSRSKDPNSYFYYALRPSTRISAYYRFSNIDTGLDQSSANSFTLRKWTLLVIGHSIWTCTISIFNNIKISINTGITYYGESGTFQMFLGKSGFSYPTFKGFIWSLRIDDSLNLQSTYNIGSGSTCLTGTGCSSSCSPAVKDSITGNGCLSEQFDAELTENGSACPTGCQSGLCKAGVCLVCNCIFGSCQVVDGQSVCFCPAGTVGTTTTCLCSGSYYYDGGNCLACESSCGSCVEAGVCLSCLDGNAFPDSFGCTCLEGFFGNKPLNSNGACLPCRSDCISCTTGTTCNVCKALNAHPSTIGCVCNPGYWGGSLTLANSCSPCHSECLTCSTDLYCDTCISNNASPNSNGGCKCNIGYGSFGALNFTNACFICFSHCASCTQDLLCNTCLSFGAEPELIQGCKCSDGFYLSGSLSTTTGCSPCHSHCKTCTESNICQTCIADFAKVSSTGCTCPEGFYESSSLSTQSGCSKCLIDCKSCSDGLSCNSCKSENTLITSGRCECLDGFYSESILIYSDSCKSCHVDCLKCLKDSVCSECKSLNASPNPFQGCDCKKSFWKDLSFSPDLFCIPCYPECLECLESTKCTVCKDLNSIPSEIGCVCKEGFFNTSALYMGGECLPCDNRCKSCFKEKYYNCDECAENLLFSVCIHECPIGFHSRNHQCFQDFKGKPSVYFKFNTLGDYKDSVNSLVAQGKSSRMRHLTSSPTVSADLRGVYLFGYGFLNVSGMGERPLFSPSFVVVAWVNPEIGSADFFYRMSDVGTLSVFLENSYVLVKIKLAGETLTFQSSSQLSLFSWSQLKVSTSFTDLTSLSISINENQGLMHSLSQEPFLDIKSSKTHIGSGDQIQNFKGFVFEFLLYIDLIEKTFSTKCENCSICPSAGFCIPTCGINQFFNKKTGKCDDCLSTCTEGCVRDTDCNLCDDFNCLTCSNFLSGSCVSCKDFFEVDSGECKKCGNRTFFDLSKKKCTGCEGLCENCFSRDRCLTCKKNSSFDKDFKCLCDLGYSGIDYCIRNRFKAELTLMSNNSVKVYFNETLKYKIKEEDILVYLSGVPTNFSFISTTLKSLTIKLSKNSTTQENSQLVLRFPKETTSSKNSLLFPTRYSIELFKSSPENLHKNLQLELKAAKKLAFNGASIGLTAIAGLSFLGWDPSTLFNFLSTAELFYSFYLFDLETYPVLEEFLIGMRLQSDIPNLLEYLISSSYGVQLPVKYVKFGFSNNLALLTVGYHFTLLAFFIFVFLLLAIIRCKWKKFLQNIWEKFKFGIFLRFWVQTNLEFLCAFAVGFRYCLFRNAVQVVDFVIGVAFIVLEIAGFLVVAIVIKRRKKETDKDRIELFEKRFPVIFEEVKTEKWFYWIGCFFYVGRRIGFGVSVFFSFHPVLQMMIQVVFSLSVIHKQVIFYTMMTKCYNKPIFVWYHFINEALITAFYSCILLKYVACIGVNWKKVSDLCIYFIIASWALNIFTSLVVSVGNVIQKVKEFLKKRRDKKIVQAYGVKNEDKRNTTIIISEMFNY